MWFGRSLCPHQSFWLPHQRNTDIEGMGGAAMLKGPRENTIIASLEVEGSGLQNSGPG